MTGLYMIASGAPLWVWPLLVLLIYIGLKATRTRTVAAWPVYVLPLLGLLSVNALNGLAPISSVWGLFAVAYLIGAGTGFKFQRSVILEKTGASVTLVGEWVTFVVLMVVFWMNFVGGVMRAIAPDTYTSTEFHLIFAAFAGLAGGIFLGRAARVLTS